MSSRNQNRAPSPSNKKGGGAEENKRRRIGGERMVVQGRGRAPLGSLNNRSDANDGAGGGATEGSEPSIIEFTKEEVEALLTEKMKKGNPLDTKKKMEQMVDLIKRLKNCVRWFKVVEEGYIKEKEKLQTDLESAEKKCVDTENEMNMKIAELNEAISNLRMTISSLEEKIAKEESDKLEVMECYRKEKEARNEAEQMQVSLSTELERVCNARSAAERQATENENLYNRSKEYNISLQQYNSSLQANLNAASAAQKRLETEKSSIVENLSNVRGHNKALQEQLASHKASQEEATKAKDMLANELKCLRDELKQIRDDRDCQLGQVQALTGEVAKYKEYTGKSSEQLGTLMAKTNALEEVCTSQRQQIDMLQQQLNAEKEKLKMADLSFSETQTVFEDQKRTIGQLQERLAEKELQVIEGETLRKKLHNTILELKGNIRVFCRVRPLLPEDGPAADMVVTFPSSTEALGRGVELAQSGQKYSFTFDKVFNQEASQQDVFTEISQLVQSALDGYKVCIFAYGQTGSGKTYTMVGRPGPPELKGLIPRSLEQIFLVSQSLKDQGWKYTMQASVLEIYNETIRDLLSPTENPGKKYNIIHDANGKNTYVPDLTIVDVCGADEISALLKQAAQSR